MRWPYEPNDFLCRQIFNMKRLLSILIIVSFAFACEKDGDGNNNNQKPLSQIVNGVWEVTNIKRTSEGVVQSVPFFLDFDTDSLYQPSTFVFSDSSMTAEVEYRYSARDQSTNTPFNSGWVSIDGDYSVSGSVITIIEGNGDTTMFTANSYSMNQMVLILREDIVEPGIDLNETNRERFTLQRLQ